MRLSSDFFQPYDVYFDLDGPIFYRWSTRGLSKPEQFKFLTSIGFNVPPYGKVCDVMGAWWDELHYPIKYVVIYDDVLAHCGEGKRLVSIAQVSFDGCVSRLPKIYEEEEKFCCAYVGRYPSIPSYSWRLLQIGKHQFWIEYRSTSDWRSNCGDGTCEIIGVGSDIHVPGYPLCAIDFAIGKDKLWAIDFNTAPGIRGTGVEQYLSGKEIVEAIKEAYER